MTNPFTHGMLPKLCILFLFCFTTGAAAPAQTFKTLISFDGTNGSSPTRSLIQGRNGNLYGTTPTGGKNGEGTIFEITPEGKLSILYNFCTLADCADGSSPQASLVLAANGNFYGTTYSGGANCLSSKGCGTVFEITPVGKLTTLYSFCSKTNCVDGQNPRAGLIQQASGNFYGTTFNGGNANSAGTLFEITPAGKLTTLHTFCSKGGVNCSDGAYPLGPMVLTPTGLYLTTSGGGAPPAALQDSTAPESDPCAGVLNWAERNDSEAEEFIGLYTFCLVNEVGAGPNGLSLGISPSNESTSDTTSSNVELFYGTNSGGGPHANGADLGGTVFSVTSAGKETTLYSFCAKANCTDGAAPGAPLVLGTDGNLYGTTVGGGNRVCVDTDGCGTVFKVTPAGALTTLHRFDKTDGEYVYGGLLQATNGVFYGMTFFGGAHGDGTIFSLSVGLGPFVQTVPASGDVGTAVMILGTDLTGATSVTFSGKTARFKVVSATEISATVPAGVATGAVEVKTPRGTLESNVAFGVLPQIATFTPASGAVGTKVKISGASLTQTSLVTFGGIAATAVAVNSNTQVTATVPSGAKTGKIAITTLGGSATSAASFTVTQ